MYCDAVLETSPGLSLERKTPGIGLDEKRLWEFQDFCKQSQVGLVERVLCVFMSVCWWYVQLHIRGKQHGVLRQLRHISRIHRPRIRTVATAWTSTAVHQTLLRQIHRWKIIHREGWFSGIDSTLLLALHLLQRRLLKRVTTQSGI